MRINTSAASLAMSATALFVALGGTAVAVSQEVGTKQIANGAVTSSKLHKAAVTTSKLANNAVTSSKLANNAVTTNKLANAAVTATKVAPNTFLAAGGTAVNSARLGDLLPGDFVQGVGIMEYRRVVVPLNTSGEPFLSSGFGAFTANCSSTGKLSVTWSPTVANAELEATLIQYPGTASVDSANGIPASGSFIEPSTAISGPMSVTFQIGYTSGLDHVVTAWVTGRFESGTGCVYIGQELSSG